MQRFFRSIWGNDRYIQNVFWFALPLVLSIPLYQRYSVQASLLITLSTCVYLYWLVFGHAYFALPHLIGPNKKRLLYLIRLLVIILIGVVIHSVFSIKLYHIIGEKEYSFLARPWSFIIWTTIECFFVIMISSTVQFSFAYFRLQAKQQQVENQRLEAELKYLKLQINPHFLFNTLNNLLLLTNKQSAQASEVVEKLAYMMRYLLEKDRKEMVPLSTEIEFLNAYIDLERIRVKDVDISFDIEGDMLQHSIPPALLITLVENAFKHGIRKTVPNNFVHIELKTCQEKLVFWVSNMLHGQAKSENKEKGIGLENLSKRLQLLFPDQHQLQVGPNNDHVFEAKLTIQV